MMLSHVVNVVMISTSCGRWFNAQEMLALSGTQRHVGGPLCTNKLQKNGKFCGLPKPNYQTACFGYIFPGWCYLYLGLANQDSGNAESARPRNAAKCARPIFRGRQPFLRKWGWERDYPGSGKDCTQNRCTVLA